MAFNIFSRSSIRGNPDEDLFVSLVCSKANEVQYCEPLSIEVTEAIGSLSPIVVITFKDMNGDLFNHMKIDTSGVWTLEFGRSLDESLNIELMVSKIEAINGLIGRPANMSFKIHFVLKNWYKVLAETHNRGWTEEQTISDVVSDIVEDCEFNTTEIHQSDSKGPFVQPYWNNTKMIKWCSTEAYSNDDDGFYCYGVNTSNNFFFYNTEQLLTEELSNIRGDRLTKFIMKSQPDKIREIVDEKNDNSQIPAYFQGVEYKEHYSTSVVNHISGYKTMWYDFETGEYKTDSVTVNDVDATQLSDFTSLRTEHTNNEIKFFGGRDIDIDKKARTSMNRQNQNTSRLTILTSGSILLSIFDFVEVNIPNTVYESKVVTNQIMSGIYMVHSITHRIGFTNNMLSLNSSIELERHGVDGIDYDGFDNLETTARGKF